MVLPSAGFNAHYEIKTNWFLRLIRKLAALFVRRPDPEKISRLRSQRFVGGVVLYKGKMISCSEDHSIRLTEMDGSTRIIAAFDHPVNHIALNADQSGLLACSDDGNVYIFDTKSLKQIKVLQGLDQSGVRKAEFTAKGKVVAAANSGQAAVWNLQTGAVQIFAEHKATVDALVIHPQKEIAVTNDMTGLTLAWDLDNLKVIKRVTEPRGNFIRGMFHFGANATCQNEKYMVFGSEIIEIFDYDFNLVHTIKGLPYSPGGISICNGVLWAGTHYFKGWKLDSWKEVFSQNMVPPIYSMTTDGINSLITGHEYGEVYVWDTTGMIGEEVEIVHMSFVNCVISNDEVMITSGEDDKSIIVWNRNGEALGRYYGFDRMIGLCCFTSADTIVFIDQACAKELNIRTFEVIREVKLEHFFRFKACHRDGDNLFLVGALGYPRVLNLVTFELTEIPFRTEFNNMSNRVGNEIVLCGNDSVPNKMKESFKPKAEGEKLLEGPLVILDMASKSITKEFWFNASMPFGMKDDDADLHPTSAFLDKNFIIAGYDDGSIAKWDRRTGDYRMSGYKSEEGMEGIYVTRKGNVVVGTYPAHQLVLLNNHLEIEKILEFQTSVWARYYDEEKNLVIVSDTDTLEMLFFDADTLELKRTEQFKDPRKIYKYAGKYFVFSSKNWACFDAEV